MLGSQVNINCSEVKQEFAKSKEAVYLKLNKEREQARLTLDIN